MAEASTSRRVLILGPAEGESPLGRFFRDEGCDVRRTDGLDEALKTAAAFAPELVFIDGDGEEVLRACAAVRSLELPHRPMVAVLSSDRSDEFFSGALEAGADDFVTKPMSDARLRARAGAWLRLGDNAADVRQDRANFEAVLGMVKAASSTLDANLVLYTIVCRLAELTGAKRCSVLLVPDEDSGYVLASNDTADISEIRIDLNRYPEIKEAIRTRDILVIEDMANHPMMAEIRDLLRGFEGMSVLVAPIAFGETVLGTMLLRAHKRNFTEKEIELCRIAANASYPALRNARTHEQLRQEKNSLLREKITTLARSEKKLMAMNEALGREMAERKKAEESIRKQAQLIRSIIDNSAAVICAKDIEGRYLLANGRFLETFGLAEEEVLGNTDLDLFPAKTARDMRANDMRVAEAKSPIEFEETTTLGDGSTRSYISVKFPLYDSSGLVYAVCGISTDITARKGIENERLKAQKLESIGVLAGGIAHDFNNILTGIIANVSLLRESPEAGIERLAALEKAVYRAKELTNQLLTFSKGGKPVKKVAHIGDLVRESADFSTKGSNLECLFDFREPLSPVEVDAGQFSQVISNLVINAKQAMPGGGTIRISAEDISQETARFVRIRVEDTGVGIPEENLGRIFDPYFTTRQGGSGLGLSSAYSIMKNHGGRIEVRSRAGEGTTFELYLPASSVEPAARRREPAPLVKGSGRLLVMDDEEMIRDVLDGILGLLGYETVFTANGEAALESYSTARDAGKPFDAVILDLTIRGGMGGKETVARLLDIDPSARVIVSSGYHNDPIMSDYRAYGFKGVIPKPYRAAEFSRVLKEVLCMK